MSAAAEDRAALLRSAGFPVRWVDYDEAEPPQDVTRSELAGSPDGMSNPQLWVDLGEVARSEDQAGQSTTVHRSNYRSLQRDHPGVWLPQWFSNVDCLGALVRDLTGELAQVLAGLLTDYPAYDEDDLSALEDDEITESYAQWVRGDLCAMLPRQAQDLWDELDPGHAEDLFWAVACDLDIRPEHTGLEVRWDNSDLRAIAGEIAARLPHAAADRAAAYQQVVWLQGDEACEVLDQILYEHVPGSPVYSGPFEETIARAIEHLAQWDTGDGEISATPAAGPDDDTARSGGYLLTWNLRLSYIGLERVLPTGGGDD